MQKVAGESSGHHLVNMLFFYESIAKDLENATITFVDLPGFP